MGLSTEILIAMKRIEIVIDEESLQELTDLCQEAEIRGYTVIKKACGLKSRRARDPEDFILEQENALMVIACGEHQAERLIMLLRPRLKDWGANSFSWNQGSPPATSLSLGGGFLTHPPLSGLLLLRTS